MRQKRIGFRKMKIGYKAKFFIWRNDYAAGEDDTGGDACRSG